MSISRCGRHEKMSKSIMKQRKQKKCFSNLILLSSHGQRISLVFLVVVGVIFVDVSCAALKWYCFKCTICRWFFRKVITKCAVKTLHVNLLKTHIIIIICVLCAFAFRGINYKLSPRMKMRWTNDTWALEHMSTWASVWNIKKLLIHKKQIRNVCLCVCVPVWKQLKYHREVELLTSRISHSITSIFSLPKHK